ncbi:MAG: hypothetical protein JWQ81_5892 [Amycolatopsis sp.]|nr:hypothetical protein [Amycolatopsis sp.]
MPCTTERLGSLDLNTGAVGAFGSGFGLAVAKVPSEFFEATTTLKQATTLNIQGLKDRLNSRLAVVTGAVFGASRRNSPTNSSACTRA